MTTLSPELAQILRYLADIGPVPASAVSDSNWQQLRWHRMARLGFARPSDGGEPVVCLQITEAGREQIREEREPVAAAERNNGKLRLSFGEMSK